MRVALISDIHSNLPALKAVMAEVGRSSVDRVVCLGDVVDMGPEPAACLALLEARQVACVGGNHDPLDEHPSDPLLSGIEAWTIQQLKPSQRTQIAAWPMSMEVKAEGQTLLCVHGSPKATTDNVLVDLPHDDLVELVADERFDVMACGHTHVQLLRRLGRRVIVNVGSLGMPFEKPYMGKAPRIYPWAEYAIVELSENGNRIELRQCAYDIEAYFLACRESGMPFAERWIAGWDWTQ